MVKLMLVGCLSLVILLTGSATNRVLLPTTTVPNGSSGTIIVRNDRVGGKRDDDVDARAQQTPTTVGDMFAPGSLPLSRLQTYHKCYTDPQTYRHHSRNGTRCSISKEDNLVYYMIAKAGSSTARLVMKESFHASEQQYCQSTDNFFGSQQNINQNSNRRRRNNRNNKNRTNNRNLGSNANTTTNSNSNTFHFTFLRDPVSRFVSSYQEAFIKWWSMKRPPVPKSYEAFLRPYQSSNTNMTRADFGKLFESPEGMQQLRDTFEQFVNDYDGFEPFDGHLRLQLPRLSRTDTGRTFPLTAIYDTANMEDGFQKVAQQRAVAHSHAAAAAHQVGDEEAPFVKVSHIYDRGKHRLNLTGISIATKRKMCQLTAIDFCCLNIALPEECADVVQCRWISKPEISKELLIEPVSPYPPPPPPPE